MQLCRFFLLKDICKALSVNYSKLRGVINRGKLSVSTLVLSGPELQEFKAAADYRTIASHLAFVQDSDLKKLLKHCGFSEDCFYDGVSETGTSHMVNGEEASLEPSAHPLGTGPQPGNKPIEFHTQNRISRVRGGSR